MAGESSGAKGFSFFGINVDLTEDGIEHVDDIVTLAFQVSCLCIANFHWHISNIVWIISI